jgi:large-conductance mechanosensitive channel
MATKRSKKTTASSNEQIRLVTSGSNIRFEPAEGKRGRQTKKNSLVVELTPELHPVSNFLGFLKEHAVVGLIIGFVLGNQVQSLVKQLIQSFLDPLTKLLFGTALSAKTFTLHLNNHSADFEWGAMVYALVIFLFVVIAMYMAIKLLNLEELEKKEEA